VQGGEPSATRDNVNLILSRQRRGDWIFKLVVSTHIETSEQVVIPAKAGIHLDRIPLSKNRMDSRFRGNDGTS